MKNKNTQEIDKAKAAFLTLLSSFVIFVLPRFVPEPAGPVVSGAGGAISFSAYLALFPDSLRSRNGSLIPAFCLMAFVWLCAAVVGAMSYLGAIKS